MIVIKILETPDNLISQMETKGIQFNIYSKEASKEFLTNHSYYKKISSYQNNFHTYIDKCGQRKFSDLDFGYLVELSRLDMEFRFLVLKMCLNFEHTLKVIALEKCLENGEDGYQIIEDYFNEFPEEKEKILRHKNNVYCKDLIETNEARIPIWVFFEVVSFGGLRKFCSFIKRKGYFEEWEIDIFVIIAGLRNAAAHSHCLFSQLIRSGNVSPHHKIMRYVAGISGITKTQKKNYLRSNCINDFVTLLYAFEYYVKSDGILNHTKDDIKQLFYKRMLQHKNYFTNCNTVKNSYNFIIKILDNWLKE